MLMSIQKIKERSSLDAILLTAAIKELPARARKSFVNGRLFLREETKTENKNRIDIIKECIGDVKTKPTHFLTIHFNKEERLDIDHHRNTLDAFIVSLSKSMVKNHIWKSLKPIIRTRGSIEEDHTHLVIWKPKWISEKDFVNTVRRLILGNKGFKMPPIDFIADDYSYDIEKITMKLINIQDRSINEMVKIIDYCVKNVDENPSYYYSSGSK